MGVEGLKLGDSLEKTQSGQEGKNHIAARIFNALDTEGSIHQMIGDIENEEIRSNLEYYLEKKVFTPERIKQEIDVYYEKLESKLQDASIKELVDRLLSKKRFLPSSLVKEIQYRDEILSEGNPEAREMMEKSLNIIYPSTIIENKDIYAELAQVIQPDEKNIIDIYIKYGLDPEGVKNEYEDYKYIKESDNENVRNLALSFIKKGNRPSVAMIYFDLFEKITEYGQDTIDYIMGIINNREKEYTVEELLYKAHFYKN